MKIALTVVSVQAAKPSYAYGQLAKIPLRSGDRRAIVRAAIPADIPVNAVVTAANLVFTSAQALTGSRVLTVVQNDKAWAVSSATWNNSPASAGTAKSRTVGAVAYGQPITVDVLSHVQSFISGASANRGWRVTTDAGTSWAIFGSTAAVGKPRLDVEYIVPGSAPQDLSPDGAAVSLAKPTLSFLAVPADELVSIQVQIDPAANETAPAWDSGEVPASAAQLNLAETTYPGLTGGTSTSWRARYKSGFGWSPWSEWATFPRVLKPTVTVLSPGTTTGDTTPPVSWTAPGQESWQVLFYDATTEKKIAITPWVTSAVQEWTPPVGLSKVGQKGTFLVRVIDGVDRVATPGDPIHASGSRTFEVVATSQAPGVDQLVTRVLGASPIVELVWSGPVTDQKQITRNGKWLARIDGSETSWRDYTAKPLGRNTYKVLAVSNGVPSPNGPLSSIVVDPAGLWLIDPETNETIMVLDEELTSNTVDQAALHAVLDAPPVRRRAGMPPPAGTVTGLLLDGLGGAQGAAAMTRVAWIFKANNPDRVYRMVYRDWNIPVTLGDVAITPYDAGKGQVGSEISFAWWQTDDELPWGDD